MSKLADAIKRSQRTESTPMGFGAARPAAKPSMLVGFLGPSGDLEKARDAGAEIVIVDAHSSGGLGKLLGASPELPADAFKVDTSKAQPGGIFTDPDVAGAKALKERGFDFIVFDANATPAAATLDEDIGYVLALASHEETFLRSLGALQLDAIYYGDMPSPLSVSKQLEIMRAASLAGKPLFVKVAADVSNEDLQCLRGAGVVAVLAAAEAVAKVKETVAALPARKSRKDDARPMVALPRGAATEEHDHGDDDDDD
jgi:hypothetical protein